MSATPIPQSSAPPIPAMPSEHKHEHDRDAAAPVDLDALRAEEFSRLDDQGHIYLDYTGGGLYADTQVRRHAELLLGGVFGNPHSTNPTSFAATELVEKCRRHVYKFFNASPEEYAVIFTANASHSLKLVGESYPFEPGDRFLLTFDNHNSVNGIREFDRAHGAKTIYVPLQPPDLRVEEEVLEGHLADIEPGRHGLFAYPAQSNFSGVQHPLEWIEKAQSMGWDVLLDAAAFVSCNRLDLSRWHPDYVALSFYKMFGHPTGVGALIARYSALEKLHRPWFAGGTIEVASVQADRYVLSPGAAAFEDGTANYTSIPAVDFGLDLLEKVKVETVHDRVMTLTGALIDELVTLRHANGRALIQLYGPASTEGRGGTVTVNFHDADGQVIDHTVIEDRANARNISLRTGCFCNPGAGEMAMGISRDEMLTCLDHGGRQMTYDDLRRCIDKKSTGAVRVSFGIASNAADVRAFLDLARSFCE